MAKLFMFIITLHIIMGVLAGVLQGGGGFVIHELTADIDDNDLAITLDSTANFIAPSTLIIGNERIRISAIPDGTHLTVAATGRGYDNTKATAHYTGAQIYTEESGTVSGSIQTRIARISDASGPLAALDVSVQILGIAKDLLVSPFTLFGSDLWIISAIYSAILASLTIVIGLQLFGGRRV